MDSDLFVPMAVFAVVAVSFGRQVAGALRTGSVTSGAAVYERRAQPIEFWSYLAFYAVVIALLLWYLAETVRDADDKQAGPLLLLFIVAAPAAFRLIRGVQTGSIGIGKSSFGRRTAPARYWGLLLAYAAVAVAAVGLYHAYPKWLPAESAYGKIVEPVVTAVRDELRMERSLRFRNVRVDGKSRLVCGEVDAGGRTRRFFGNAVQDAAMVRLEDEDPGFDPAYQRVCGAPGYVPEN
jgi:hypothetical protein